MTARVEIAMTQLIRQAEAWLKARWAKTRLDDESGAVTVDWVVLTAAIMGLSLAIVGVLWDSLTTNVGFLNRTIEEKAISTSFE